VLTDTNGDFADVTISVADVGPGSYSLVAMGLSTDGELVFNTSSLSVTAVPPMPGAVDVVPAPNALVVSWQAPEDPDMLVVGYEARASNGTDQWTCSTAAADDLSCTIFGLDPNTEYTVEVVSMDDNGTASDPTMFDGPVMPLAVMDVPAPTDQDLAGAAALTSPAPGATVTAGSTITVSGSGFAGRVPVKVWIMSTPIQLTPPFITGDDGAFSISVTLPADLTLGTHHIVVGANDPDGNVAYLASAVNVVAPAVAAPTSTTTTSTTSGTTASTLAVTGSSLTFVMLLGLGLLASGTGLVAATGRKRIFGRRRAGTSLA
jgi:hypothetical protein